MSIHIIIIQPKLYLFKSKHHILHTPSPTLNHILFKTKNKIIELH